MTAWAGDARFNGAGSLSARGALRETAGATFAGVGTLSAMWGRRWLGAATFHGLGALSADTVQGTISDLTLSSIAIIPNTAYAAGTEVDDTSITAVTEGAGGYSGRELIRQAPLRNFHLTVGPDDVPEIRAIFLTHRRRWPLLVRDQAGYTWNDQVQVLDDFDTNSANYKLRVLIQPVTGARYYHRRVLHVDERQQTAVVKVNGTPLLRSQWGLSDFGLLSIPLGVTTSTDVVTMSFQELVPVCFTADTLTYKVFAIGSSGPIMGIQSLTLREIPEQELIDLMAQDDDSA